jgi:deoxycytidylate deaminase
MYDENIMKLALTISHLSKDPTTKVGCVITNQDNEVMSVGYNKIFVVHILLFSIYNCF